MDRLEKLEKENENLKRIIQNYKERTEASAKKSVKVAKAHDKAVACFYDCVKKMKDL